MMVMMMVKVENTSIVDDGDCNAYVVEYQHNGLIFNSGNVSSSDLHLGERL